MVKAELLSPFIIWQNKDVTEAIQKVAAAYDCKIVEGVLSHQLKQFVIDGNKVVLSVPSPETRVDDAEFEENEVYAVDIVTSTGDGKVIMGLILTQLLFSLFIIFLCSKLLESNCSRSYLMRSRQLFTRGPLIRTII